MNLLLRRAELAQTADAAAVVDLLDSYAGDPIGGGQPLGPEVRRRLPAALRDHPTAHVFLAFVDQAAVGVAVCFVGLSTFRAQPLLNIHDLAVLSGWRGRGIGRALLAAVEAHARQLGCCKLTLEVLDQNHRARGLYERFGFADVIVAGSPTRFLSKPLSGGSAGQPT